MISVQLLGRALQLPRTEPLIISQAMPGFRDFVYRTKDLNRTQRDILSCHHTRMFHSAVHFHWRCGNFKNFSRDTSWNIYRKKKDDGAVLKWSRSKCVWEVQRGGGGIEKTRQSYRNWKQCEARAGHQACGGSWNSPPTCTHRWTYNTQPTHARRPARVERLNSQRDGREEIKPRQLPEEAMALDKGTLIWQHRSHF